MLESLEALLGGLPPAGNVWTADITYWMAGEAARGRADPAWRTEEGYLALHRRLGVMPYYYYETFWAGEPRYDATVVVSEQRAGQRLRRTIATPVGTLTEESVFLEDSACWGTTRHFVEKEADLDVLLYVLEHRSLAPTNTAGYRARRRTWAAFDGLPALGLPRSPLPAFCYEWAGMQNTVYLMLDCEQKVLAALDLMEGQEADVLDAVCDLAPPLVHFPDNLSSDNLTPFYDAHMARRHESRLRKLHGAGIRAAVHLDGTVAGLLPKLIRSGFDAVEALTPEPAGDLAVEAIARLAGDAPVILWGGVPGAMFAPPYTWEEMRSHVERLLAAWSGLRFIVGVADQVPPDGDITLCRRIAEML
jgi:hypothetical protein